MRASVLPFSIYAIFRKSFWLDLKWIVFTSYKKNFNLGTRCFHSTLKIYRIHSFEVIESADSYTNSWFNSLKHYSISLTCDFGYTDWIVLSIRLFQIYHTLNFLLFDCIFSGLFFSHHIFTLLQLAFSLKIKFIKLCLNWTWNRRYFIDILNWKPKYNL